MKKKIIVAVTPALFYLVLGTVFWGKHSYMLFSQLLFQLIFTGYIYNRFVNLSKLKTVAMSCIILLLLFILASIINLDFSRSILYIFFTPIFSYIGIQIFDKRQYVFIPLSLLLSYFLSFTVFSTVMALNSRKDYFRDRNIPDIILKNNKNEVFNLPNNKIIVLDFWFTKCPPCLESFPHFENIYKKYIYDENVVFYAVNSPLPNENFQYIVKFSNDLKYQFPHLFTNSIDNTKKAFKFNSFPHVIIIKNNKIRFSGTPNYNTLFKVNSLENEINKLIKE